MDIKELTSNLNFGTLYNVCETLYPLYESRVEFNKNNNLDDQACDKVYRSWMMEMKREEWTERWYMGIGPLVPVLLRLKEDQLENLGLSMQLIKEDILESIGIYESLYGPHPRRNEFL